MNRDELSVYADQLQIEGDIRGEIIALELLLAHAKRPELVARHEALMKKWLGPALHGWNHVRFKHGFVDCAGAELAGVLATPAAPFLRSVTVSGNTTEIVEALRLIAAAPRPHLARLSLAQYRRWGDLRAPRLRSAPVVDDALAAALIAATPSLELLDVTGSRMLDAFPHPTVQRLRVVGHDAIPAIAEAGPAMPAVHALFFGFTHDPEGRITFPEGGLRSTLLARATLPALRTLDVSANELQRSWDSAHVALFEMLLELGVLPHLAHLRVPPLLEDAERDALAQVRATTAAVIEDTGDRPRPLHDALERNITLGVRVHQQPREYQLSYRRLGELMSAAWPALDGVARAAWFELWDVLAAVPREPDDYFWNDQNEATPVPLRAFARALATLGERVDDDFPTMRLAEAVIGSAETRVDVRRYPY